MGSLSKMLIFMFAVNIILFVMSTSDLGKSLGLNIGISPVTSLFHINSDNTTSLRSGSFDSISSGGSAGSSPFDLNGLISIMWGTMKSFIGIVFGFLFAPVNLMISLGVTWQIYLPIGIIWAMAYLTAILSAVWRYDI